MVNLGELFGQPKRAIGLVAGPFRYEVSLAVVSLTNRPVTIFLSGREEGGQTIGISQNGADRQRLKGGDRLPLTVFFERYATGGAKCFTDDIGLSALTTNTALLKLYRLGRQRRGTHASPVH